MPSRSRSLYSCPQSLSPLPLPFFLFLRRNTTSSLFVEPTLAMPPTAQKPSLALVVARFARSAQGRLVFGALASAAALSQAEAVDSGTPRRTCAREGRSEREFQEGQRRCGALWEKEEKEKDCTGLEASRMRVSSGVRVSLFFAETGSPREKRSDKSSGVCIRRDSPVRPQGR